MEPLVQFFQNLPKKICAECGEEIVEQYESYMIECLRCMNQKEE